MFLQQYSLITHTDIIQRLKLQIHDNKKIVSILAGIFCYAATHGQVDTTSVYEMSLEDLMNVQVATGSLVSTSQFMTPSAVTTITSDDIEKYNTPQFSDHWLR